MEEMRERKEQSSDGAAAERRVSLDTDREAQEACDFSASYTGTRALHPKSSRLPRQRVSGLLNWPAWTMLQLCPMECW